MTTLAVLIAEGPGVDMKYATMNVWIKTRHSVQDSMAWASEDSFLATDIRRSIGGIQRPAAEFRSSIRDALKENIQ